MASLMRVMEARRFGMSLSEIYSTCKWNLAIVLKSVRYFFAGIKSNPAP